MLTTGTNTVNDKFRTEDLYSEVLGLSTCSFIPKLSEMRRRERGKNLCIMCSFC